MKRWKIIIIGSLIMVLIALAYGFYLYNKKPADVRSLKPAYEISATALIDDYNKDETAANKKYLDKVISVKGKVADIKFEPTTAQSSVILESGDPMASVICSFYEDEAKELKKINKGDEIVVKGKCTGKLMDVILNKCSINKYKLSNTK